MTLEHISYSQYATYSKCARSWYLGRVRQAEEKQTWYLPIGTAVHNMIEDWINPEIHFAGRDAIKASDYFYPLIEKQMLIESDLSKWLAGGPEAAPITHEKALQRVTECFEKAVEELDDMEVWEVEYDASGSLPGLEVPLKAYVDIIGEHKKKGPGIWDWKTGSTKPDNFQLITYAALLKENDSLPFTTEDFKGRYVMLAPGAPNTRYVDLSKVDPAEVGAKYQAVYAQMKAKIYKANAGFNCRFCFNQDSCLANAGPTAQARYYDHSATDGCPY